MFPCLIVNRSHDGFGLRWWLQTEVRTTHRTDRRGRPRGFGAVRSYLDRKSRVTAAGEAGLQAVCQMTAVLLALGRKNIHNAWPSRIYPFEE